MSERAELIIDTEEIDDEDILFLNPNHIRGVRYCASNIFDYASIKHCPTEKLNSGSLIGIFNSLKPGAEITIVVNQPISVMLEYDSKQIEANLKLVGFENISYEEKKSSSKNGVGIIEGILTAIKPVNKDNNIQIEIIKNDYSYRNKSDKKKDRDYDREDRGGYKIKKKTDQKVWNFGIWLYLMFTEFDQLNSLKNKRKEEKYLELSVYMFQMKLSLLVMV